MISEKPTTQIPASSRPSVWWVVVAGAVVLLGIGVYGLFRPRPTPLQQVHGQYLRDIAQLDSVVRQLQRGIVANRPAAELQTTFKRARLAWKRIEFLAELYNPETSKSINGPNLPEADEADKRVEQPEGLQVLEEFLFPYDLANHDDLTREAAILVSNVGRLTSVATVNQMTDSHIFDAMRLDVFRLITLGITGFDSPVARASLPEAVSLLESLQRHLTFYDLTNRNPRLAQQLDQTFTASIAALQKSPDFDSFDRLGFITHQANVLSGLLLDAQKSLNIPVFRESRFLAASARTLNDRNAFDPAYFVDTDDDRPTADRTALGKMLFYDPILSGNGQRTCATCHQPKLSFTDGEHKSLAVGQTNERIARNAPTLLNASFQASQFMDSRVVFLEDQAVDVISNPTEMHGSLPDAVWALQQRNDYRQAFATAYSAGVTEHTVRNALASYVRSLTSLDSRVDRYLRGGRGTETLLTDEEKYGFNLFMGKAQCATCHFFPLFNGTVPPAYQKTESEVLGTPATLANKTLDPDIGKFATTAMDLHKFAFKTPTVRHVAQTAPYMHNGAYQTLDQVVDFYNRGGGNGLGFKLPNQTLPEDKLNLTKPEQRALVAFMKAL